MIPIILRISRLQSVPEGKNGACLRFSAPVKERTFLIGDSDALLSSTTTIWWNSHARTPLPLVGQLRYGPKRQVQGDPVTLEKSSPNQTTWAGVLPRPHHPYLLFFNILSCVVKATMNPPIVMDMVIFRTIFFELFSFLHVHAPYPPFRLLTNLGTHQTRQNTVIRTAD